MADHVKNLEKLRKALIERRRELVATWATRLPQPAQLGALDDIRGALEAIAEAIKEEEESARKPKAPGARPAPVAERYTPEVPEE